ncbi:MAG: P-protein [Turneriella sp.]|nr:P-protein [Turneriella sp.]
MKKWRDQIDNIDAEIIRLIGERANCAIEIAKAKAQEGAPLFQPDREQEVYAKIARLNAGVLSDESIKNIYREIMGATLKLEGSIDVGYFGAEGSFTHQAAIYKFGHSLPLYAFRTIDEVFQNVQTQKIKYGIVPIENSTEGMVKATLDALRKYDLHIYSDSVMQIKQSLLSTAKDVSQIKKIFTHPQAYAQAQNYISKNLHHAEWVETASTSEAAKRVSKEKNPEHAAIASKTAGEIYALPILVQDITDYERNFTRFVVVGHDKAKRGKENRTMVSFNLPHSTGSLYNALRPLYEEKINMRAIESRPDKLQAWNYTFFLDIEGHIEDEPIKRAFEKMQPLTAGFRILGSYPVEETNRPYFS